MTEPADMKRCRNCQRPVQHVDGVGWLHLDARIYFVPQAEPQCDTAEPDDNVSLIALTKDGVTTYHTADRGCRSLGGTFWSHGFPDDGDVCWCGSQRRGDV